MEAKSHRKENLNIRKVVRQVIIWPKHVQLDPFQVVRKDRQSVQHQNIVAWNQDTRERKLEIVVEHVKTHQITAKVEQIVHRVVQPNLRRAM